jgi:hypothetical protein
MLAPVEVVEALDFSVVVVAVEAPELLVLLPDPHPVDRNIKTVSVLIATMPNADSRFIYKSLMFGRYWEVQR